jgi:AraC-like DNA-binding protein
LQKDAYEKGIHDWIQKPFVSNILLLKVSNILKSRKLLFENEIKTKIEKQQDKGEKQFRNQLIEIIEKHIDDISFGVDQLADSTKMSRMQLHRKLMATVGKSSSELIKEIRLNKAKELIASGKFNISEVYFHVGFSSNSYFTKVFKEFFGALPS